MRHGLFVAVVLCLAVQGFSQQINVVPTTTLTAETTNNSAAPATIAGYTNAIAASGNVSKVPMRSLLYAGADTKVYAALMGWFGKSSHIQVGYNSDDPLQVQRQVVDMQSRGIDGAILAWYGKGNNKEDLTARQLKAEAELHPPFSFAIMIDKGAIEWNSMGLSPTDALIVHLNYIADTYYSSPAYMRIGGRPVVFEFALEFYTIDWTRVRSSIAGNPMIIYRNPTGYTRPYTDGAYAWAPSQSTMGYLDYFFQQAAKYPTLKTFGGVAKGFNDSLASWSQQRFVDQRCGQTWLDSFAEQNKFYSATKPLGFVQVATWNDYEEGTTIESGIDNCLDVTAGMVGTSLHWSLSGAGIENTIDHYTVFISKDGVGLMPLLDVETGTSAVDLSRFTLPAGNYQLFVKAVGKPSILNQMSAAAPFTVRLSKAAKNAPRRPRLVSGTSTFTIGSTAAGPSTVRSRTTRYSQSRKSGFAER